MSNFKAKFTPQELKTSTIQIASYENKNFIGTLQNPHYKELKVFSNLTQLLLLIEELQDAINYPQKSMEPRTLRSDDYEPLELPEVAEPQTDILATFKLRILFRQNASWQGSIIWVDEGLEAQFRSVLELISMMDSVLS